MSDSIEELKKVQARLNVLGYDAGVVDGIMGKNTEAAIVAFKKAHGLAARPYLGPITMQLLFQNAPRSAKLPASATPQLPWMNEISKHIRWHERTNFKDLFAWLRSDKSSVGDPRANPWCGDAVETSIKLTLPEEQFPGALGRNPYLARNWLLFGKNVGPRYGAVVVFWRGSRQGTNGHVGFAIGYDPVRRRIRVRGGNQSDSISDTWLDEDRLLGYRVPTSWAEELPPLPTMDSTGAIVSTNEA